MILLVLEALAALCVLALIVWWTMFSGRSRGELAQPPSSANDEQAANAKSAEHSKNKQDF
jgi:cyanate permease